ncbi:hypothetical protein AJ80_01048 [Polytolypa hystricis UAMH7299]|uniref:Thioesterase/thiol ester dehydrase-isomerase n=1 Tax=Polytolypa hystricis (strain UAMH7299) TaxID=1447883 RepID=A0A2B7Z076_POLH7|nr:hypothetical protein AJ80_01048 [Polytolypa hystricis UAMH7299]
MTASRVPWRQSLYHFCPPLSSRSSARLISTTPLHGSKAVDPSHIQSDEPAPYREIDSRWLSTIKKRVAKCVTFGLQPHQSKQAGDVLQIIARDWRQLVAGSEGFLTGGDRRGLFCHNVVWGEMHIPGHVNNVAYVRYAETARVNWTRNFGTHIDPVHKQQWLELIGSTAIGLILKSIKVDYKFPMTSPDKITVYHKLSNPPPPISSAASTSYSAFHLDVLILSEARQRPAARCYEDIVTYDYRIGRKAGLPGFMLDQFRHTWELQERSKRHWSLRAQEIEDRVRELEMASWDREDAVEDMGSAGGR